MRKLTAMLILLALLSGCGAASGPEIVQYWNMRAEALPKGMNFVNDLCVTKDGGTVLGGDGLYLGSGEGYAACALPEDCAQILAISPAPEGGFAALPCFFASLCKSSLPGRDQKQKGHLPGALFCF